MFADVGCVVVVGGCGSNVNSFDSNDGNMVGFENDGTTFGSTTFTCIEFVGTPVSKDKTCCGCNGSFGVNNGTSTILFGCDGVGSGSNPIWFGGKVTATDRICCIIFLRILLLFVDKEMVSSGNITIRLLSLDGNRMI